LPSCSQDRERNIQRWLAKWRCTSRKCALLWNWQSGSYHRFPKPLSQFIYPPSAYSEAAQVRNQQQLTDTHIAQPAIGAVEAGYLDLVTRLGIDADMVAGHSYGEYAALYAAGVLSREAFLKLSETRGRVMSAACAAADGAMAAVQATREELLARLDGLPASSLLTTMLPCNPSSLVKSRRFDKLSIV
jgi:acyl transferase domain-containing protein